MAGNLRLQGYVLRGAAFLRHILLAIANRHAKDMKRLLCRSLHMQHLASQVHQHQFVGTG